MQNYYNNPDQPTLASFKEFLTRELNRINTTFTQRFLGLSKERTDHKSFTPVSKVKVHRANIEAKPAPGSNQSRQFQKSQPNMHPVTSTRKPLPVCFICSSSSSEYRHLLYNCEIYQNMTHESRRNTIAQAGYCLNCLQQHQVKDCTLPCKCKHCSNTFTPKHTTSLHDLFQKSSHPGEAFGAANYENYKPTNVGDRPHNTSVKQVEVKQSDVFTRVSAVRVINPRTGDSSMVYAQHDPGSQVTLMSTSLVEELGLVNEGKCRITLHTLSSSQTQLYARVVFNLETTHTHECFDGLEGIVIPSWSESDYNLPHNQDLSLFPHFEGVTTCVLSHRSEVDIIIGLDNSHLMKVIEERVGDVGQPHAIKTPLGWIASGGSFQQKMTDLVTRRVSISPTHIHQQQELKIRELQETIRDLEAESETTQPSINDLEAQMVENDG